MNKLVIYFVQSNKSYDAKMVENKFKYFFLYSGLIWCSISRIFIELFLLRKYDKNYWMLKI